MQKLSSSLLALLLLTGLSAQAQSYENIDAETFYKLLQEQPGTLLDVRTTREFRNGHLPESGQLNYYARDFRSKLELLPTDSPIYLYCNTGYRSERAAQMLAQAGYTQVYNMQYGIMEWNYRRLPIVVDPNAEPDREHVVSIEDYEQITQSEPLVFVDFYAPWCAPCREMVPMFDSLLSTYHAHVHLLKVNADASKKLVVNRKLMSVPYLILYKNGKEVFTHNGKISRNELEQLFISHIESK